jgi:hypothetical protein
LELRDENYIFLAIDKKLREYREEHIGGRWGVTVERFSIWVREQGIQNSVKVIEMDEETGEIIDFVDGAKLSNNVVFNDIELKMETREKALIIAKYIEENYLSYVHLRQSLT